MNLATTAGISITITGVYFDQTQTDSYTNKVTINDIDCPHTNSWTNTQISCIPADATQVGKDLVVKVYTKNGKFTYQQHNITFLRCPYLSDCIGENETSVNKEGCKFGTTGPLCSLCIDTYHRDASECILCVSEVVLLIQMLQR